MNRYLALILLLVCMSLPLCAQDMAPGLLHQATQCLVIAKPGWIDLSTLKPPVLNLSYMEDTKTAFGDKYMWVIVYNSPARTDGRIFDIRLKHHDRRQVFSIENSASFSTASKKITFPEPPVGGEWAQTQLTTAIKQIERRKWYVIQAKELQKPNSKFDCESYTEARP